MRIAIITAYFKEERATIERCIDSVRSQTQPAEHILVAHGHPQAWIGAGNLRQIVLDRNNDDFGDTPRAIGLVVAIREGYDAVQFLDADNVIDPHHVAMSAGMLRSTGAHMLVLKRRFLRQDGSVLNFISARDETLAAIDTNCYLFARPSFPTALKWTLIPKELSYMGATVFRSVFSKAGHPVAVASEPTVGYTSMWANTYTEVGETPPPGFRDHSLRAERARAWWSGLDDARRTEIQSALGVTITVVP